MTENPKFQLARCYRRGMRGGSLQSCAEVGERRGEEFGRVSSLLQMSWSVVSKEGEKIHAIQMYRHRKAQKALKSRRKYRTNKNQGSCIYRKELSCRVKALGTKGAFKIL